MTTETKRAIKELELAGLFDKDSDYSGMTGNAVKELLEVFQAQRHSGFSAGQVTSLFNKLATGGILSPLTGKEDEWVDMSEPSGKPLFQNNRASHVFAEDSHGKNAFDINGKTLEDPAGNNWSNSSCRTLITFPYTPTTAVVEVDDNLNPIHTGVLKTFLMRLYSIGVNISHTK